MRSVRSRRITRTVLVVLVAVAVAVYGQSAPEPAAAAAGPEPIRYAYDDAGRLIGVTDPAGESATYAYDPAGNLTGITRRPSSQVSVLSVSPSRGAVGTRVTVTGTGFAGDAGDDDVTFNGIAATVDEASETQLVVTVPAGASTGPVEVTAPAGSAVSSGPFTVDPASAAPTSTGFSPASGAAGTVITITGTGFDPDPARDGVLFNQAVRGKVTAATPTSLTVETPSVGAGGIAVRTGAGTATSAEDFTVAPLGYSLSDVASTTRIEIGGAVVDGRAAGRPRRDYGTYEIGVDLAGGRTTVLPSAIWLTRIDHDHTARFRSPTTGEIVVTTPRIPGLEVRLPAGSVVKDLDGKVVRELGITAIPATAP